VKKLLFLIFIIGVVSTTFAKKIETEGKAMLGVASPEWTKDLVIYEISTKNFNSPNKSQGGTFNSVAAKMPYLSNLGVNGIWLTGHHLAHENHFFNIWTQYACIDPEVVDPTLGTDAQFRQLIDEAHKNGIKVFLDVITHGLMPESRFVKDHPDWFKGGSWGMVDFDWKAHNKELDDWWVNLYTNYVIDYGIDGYRLDLDIHRPDLWLRIRENAAAAGHPIIVLGENWEYGNYEMSLEGVMEFTQKSEGNITPTNAYLDWNHGALNDMAGFAHRVFDGNIPTRPIIIEVFYCDGSVVSGKVDEDGALKITDKGVTVDRVGKTTICPDGIVDLEILVEGVDPELSIKNVVVKDRHGVWQMRGKGNWFAAVERAGTELTVHVSPFRYNNGAVPGFIIGNVSMHDNGWEGFPIDENPYVTHFSRAVFGYASLLSPMVPLLFSGEEFSAEFRPNTELSYTCFERTEEKDGKERRKQWEEELGRGRWLYGSWLDWSQLEKTKHKKMLEDVRKMLSIRKQHKDLIHAKQRHEEIEILAVETKSNIDVPVPYVYWNKEKAIVVGGSFDTKTIAKLTMNIPVAQIGMGGCDKFIVEDLWNGGKKTVTAAQMKRLQVSIKQDKRSGGGIGVWKIEMLRIKK